jgi:hypothetical protein
MKGSKPKLVMYSHHKKYQDKKANTAIDITIQVKYPAIISASLAIGAFEL